MADCILEFAGENIGSCLNEAFTWKRFKMIFIFVAEQLCPRSVVELQGSGSIQFPIQADSHILSYYCSWRITVSPGKVNVNLMIKSVSI